MEEGGKDAKGKREGSLSRRRRGQGRPKFYFARNIFSLVSACSAAGSTGLFMCTGSVPPPGQPPLTSTSTTFTDSVCLCLNLPLWPLTSSQTFFSLVSAPRQVVHLVHLVARLVGRCAPLIGGSQGLSGAISATLDPNGVDGKGGETPTRKEHSPCHASPLTDLNTNAPACSCLSSGIPNHVKHKAKTDSVSSSLPSITDSRHVSITLLSGRRASPNHRPTSHHPVAMPFSPTPKGPTSSSTSDPRPIVPSSSRILHLPLKLRLATLPHRPGRDLPLIES